MHVSTILLVVIVAWWIYSWIPAGVIWYQITTSIKSLKEVAALPQEEVEKCMDAFDNMVSAHFPGLSFSYNTKRFAPHTSSPPARSGQRRSYGRFHAHGQRG